MDAAPGETMMSEDVEQAIRIIDVFASTDHQAQHIRQSIQKIRVVDLTTHDAILA